MALTGAAFTPFENLAGAAGNAGAGVAGLVVGARSDLRQGNSCRVRHPALRRNAGKKSCPNNVKVQGIYAVASI